MKNKDKPDVNKWEAAEHVLAYLSSTILPHAKEIRVAVSEQIPFNVKRVLDLGTDNGRLLASVKPKTRQLRA